jgi:phosphatidylserine/phosphatidylglycerophosphate/cardiolipin synthase-like enzyme
VITGSFNFTKAAEEKNAENLLVIKSKELAKVYLENWEKHRDHSISYSQNAHVNTPITRSANNQGNNISDHEQQPTRFFLKSIFH